MIFSNSAYSGRVYKKNNLLKIMSIVFETVDKNGKRIHLSIVRLKHIQKHPYMDDPINKISLVLKRPTSIRYFPDDEAVVYFYKEFKNMLISERYLLVSVKYLNGEGFIITSFFTNKIEGIKWKTK